jgi:hypothetical protein
MTEFIGRCLGCDRRCDEFAYCQRCGCFFCESCETNPQNRTDDHDPTDHLDIGPLDEVVQ